MKARDIIAGLLFFIAVGVALFFAMRLGGDGSIRFGAEQTAKIRFANVQGLQQNSPVWISGVPMGRVREMFVDRTGTVEVKISLDSSVRLNSDCYAEIIPSSAFGGRAIALYIGDAPTPHDMDNYIEGRVVEDLFTAAGRGIGKINEGIDLAVDTVKDVNAIVKDVRDGRGPIGTILRDEKVAGDIAATVENVRATSEDVKGITANVRDITDKVNAGDGMAAMLLDDADTALRMKNIVRNVEDATDNTVGASRSIKSIAAKLDNGKGLFGMLLNDEETGENVKEAIAGTPQLVRNASRVAKELGDTMEGVNKGEGTVGKLFKNDTLFNDTLNAINTLRAGFEDIREQAPITTFASLLFQVLQ
ncbi:MAG: MCE family protein [Planctomycetes bacterium]|nr:MCE family protein [Planctomycetota bacterium]MCW8134742.1 MCE family protein [Planctomycetota bacterium]